MKRFLLLLSSIFLLSGLFAQNNVGIGTTTPNFPLTVIGNQTGQGRGIAQKSGDVEIGFYTTSDNLAFVQTWSNHPLRFATNDNQSQMILLTNGNVGIGAEEPAFRLDVDRRMRIRSGGTGSTSAGIWLNRNDNSTLLGFIGVDGNNDIGIFSSVSNWSFLVNSATGNAWVKGTVTANGVTLTSDERLKKDITPISAPMPLLEKLNGYQYHWKDETCDVSLQTGLLAQEVEKVLPELVKTDGKGMKSVNYMGLIPYMLEALKAQQRQIDELKQLVLELTKK